MLIHPQFNPVALQLGPVAIHWYGITYLVAFALFLALTRRRLGHDPYARQSDIWNPTAVEDLLFYGVLGVVLGGRLGYCLFYKPDYYVSHPLEIAAIWQGGMSFHGGMLGVILAMVLWAYRHQLPWLAVTDFIAPCVPTGLACGRIGNFINAVIAFVIKAAVVFFVIVKPFQALMARMYPPPPPGTPAVPPDIQLLTEIRDVLKAK